MAKYVIFDIGNVEPIKISSTVMQSDNEYSRSYIPGAAIRGAYISNYINVNDIKNLNSGIHREKLLRGGIKFLNAYPVINEVRSLPFPRCFYALKDDIKKYSVSKKMRISMFYEDTDRDIDKVKGFEFANFNFSKEALETRGIDKINNLHIKKEAKNKIFRYEAIDSGEKFRGIIKCENDDYIEEIEQILKKGLFYIGGSKGSGYGKCKIDNINVSEKNPEIRIFGDEVNDFEDSESFSIYASSDILYRDKFGIYKSYIDEEYLREKLGLEEIKFENSFVDMEYFTGFNNKWRCRLPIVNGIKSGSILIYKFKGNLNPDNIRNFEEEGIGERKQDGFGRFIILPDIDQTLSFDQVILSDSHNEKTEEIEVKDEEDKNQLGMILDRIYLNKINKKLSENVLGMDSQMNLSLNKNQFGKLTELMDILLRMKYEDGIIRLKDYFQHVISDKKINRELANKIEMPFMDGKPLKDYMLSELENNDKFDFENKYGQPFKIGGVESKFHNKAQAMYNYKLRIFKELFRMQLKDNSEGGEN
ncbi:RAMP superfamily CRISPR-associated protein [Clostridium sp. WLY-B-L2]|uniref:RAMP superfamily CRISPR-associated protein n=1 Tax=Clostridium aromativorans TaxID=2836848 RepID=A0ABS8N543_9CLOT|nr:RAMP superfamily CRISPR-associated protein [Clostridium aromativorans]MCC9294926.1 RAMP superfamily CRISPR-associated protein [Clostridium aromativorans]